jgi:hypothetical protein
VVRREASVGQTRSVAKPAVASCIIPSGASPVPVSAGAPGSRLQVPGEIPVAQAGRRKPVKQPRLFSGEQASGPQHQVKPEASSESQWESRAAHVTAKAMLDASVPERASNLPGVRGAARLQGMLRNTRGPSALPSSRQGDSYKPKAKSSAAQRESEGLVVPSMVATNNAAGGKGPCFGHARREGKREGMAAKSGPNDPGARTCAVQVRQPQRELWAGAERRGPWRRSARNRMRGDARVRVLCRDGSPVVHAPSRRPSVSRMPEIGTYGLKGGPALSLMTNIE